MATFQRTLRGIKLKHLKHTAYTGTVEMPLPARVRIPLRQHIGAACLPLVAKGDRVLVGQKIGDSDAFVSAPVHASISGTVAGIEWLELPQGRAEAVVIDSDGLGERIQAEPPRAEDLPSFLAAVRESGLVGLGGAGFPTHVKLGYRDIDRVHTLVVNAAECEPYITSDNRECVETPEDVIEGIELVRRFTGIRRAIIVTESNKLGAARILRECAGTAPIAVKVLRSIYPKGAEKVAVFEATGIAVEDGKLPADCGVIVLNVTTVAEIARYLRTGMPLIRKRITIDGDVLRKPMNAYAAIGTPVEDVMRLGAVDEERLRMIVMGGVMMGACAADYQYPVLKSTNAVLFFQRLQERNKSACIRCSRCIAVCPLKLMPAALERAYDARDAGALRRLRVNVCMNCGCCTYVCPAKRDLAHKNSLAKQFLKQGGG